MLRLMQLSGEKSASTPVYKNKLLKLSDIYNRFLDSICYQDPKILRDQNFTTMLSQISDLLLKINIDDMTSMVDLKLQFQSLFVKYCLAIKYYLSAVQPNNHDVHQILNALFHSSRSAILNQDHQDKHLVLCHQSINDLSLALDHFSKLPAEVIYTILANEVLDHNDLENVAGVNHLLRGLARDNVLWKLKFFDIEKQNDENSTDYRHQYLALHKAARHMTPNDLTKEDLIGHHRRSSSGPA